MVVYFEVPIWPILRPGKRAFRCPENEHFEVEENGDFEVENMVVYFEVPIWPYWDLEINHHVLDLKITIFLDLKMLIFWTSKCSFSGPQNWPYWDLEINHH